MLPHVFSGFSYVERFYSYTQLGSTNEKAVHFPEIPKTGVFVFQTDSRTNGKERSGNYPNSETQGGLWVSILHQQSDSPVQFHFTRIISLAIISSIKHFFPDASLLIKWPDRILWGRKEICNIQIEPHHTAASAVIIGFGLNVNMLIEAFPAHLHSVTTSVFIETGKKIPLSTLLRKIMESYKDFIGKVPQENHSQYCSLLGYQGEQVTINSTEGIFKTVTIDGQAIIETESGSATIKAGTIHCVEEG
jgi:BirA family biotin operon repressor/biotin-[acetyl-CoA-carboxylase] ligase